MTEGRGLPVTGEGGIEGVVSAFKLGVPLIRVDDVNGVQEIQCQPETASESAGADTTGNQGE